MTSWFCDACASWQKGGALNANGRRRRQLPRHLDLDSLSPADLQEIVLSHNLTPRKCRGYPRDPARTVHSTADILRFRMLLITAGYEDGIDANALRGDPVFKLALERLPGERDLCSQSTISRLENLPDRRMLLRLARAMVGLDCASFAQVPKRLTLDIPGLEGGHLRCRARRTAAAAVQRPLR